MKKLFWGESGAGKSTEDSQFSKTFEILKLLKVGYKDPDGVFGDKEQIIEVDFNWKRKGNVVYSQPVPSYALGSFLEKTQDAGILPNFNDASFIQAMKNQQSVQLAGGLDSLEFDKDIVGLIDVSLEGKTALSIPLKHFSLKDLQRVVGCQQGKTPGGNLFVMPFRLGD